MFTRIIFIIILLILPANSYAAEKEYVILLHGINRSSKSMEKLADYFKKNGYETLNVNYASTKYTIDILGERLDRKIKAKIPKNAKINFVSYSMGTLISRLYIHKYKPKNLGRVVLIAPPNNGSEIADFLMDNPAYQLSFGPAGQELGTGTNSIIKKLPAEFDYDMGVIAGDRTIDPISSFIIPGKDDGKVSIKSTKLKGMKDHIIIHASHTFIMKNKTALKQSLYFLRNGIFKKE